MVSHYYTYTETPFSAKAAAVAFLGGLLIAVLTVCLYDYALKYLPFINIIAFIVIPLSIHSSIKMILQSHHIRHKTTSIVINLLVCVCALYLHIAIVVAPQPSPSLDMVTESLSHPSSTMSNLMTHIQEASNTPHFSWRGREALYSPELLRLIQTLIIIGVPLYYAVYGPRTPFSEEDNDRYQETNISTIYDILTTEREDISILQQQTDEIVQQFEKGAFTILVPILDGDRYDSTSKKQWHITVDLYSDRARQSFYVRIIEHRGDDNEWSVLPTKTIVDLLSIDKETVKAMWWYRQILI